MHILSADLRLMEDKNKCQSCATQIFLNSESSLCLEWVHWRKPPHREDSSSHMPIWSLSLTLRSQIKVIPLPPTFDSWCLFCVSLTVENNRDIKTPSCFMNGVRLSFLCIPHSDPVAFRMPGVCVCCGNHNVEKKWYCICVLLLFWFVVMLGCSLPLVYFLSWIPPQKKKKKTKPPQPPLSPLFCICLLKASLLRFSWK